MILFLSVFRKNAFYLKDYAKVIKNLLKKDGFLFFFVSLHKNYLKDAVLLYGVGRIEYEING